MSAPPRSRPPRLGLALLVGALVLTVFVVWSLLLRSQEQRALEAAVEGTRVDVTSELEAGMESPIAALVRFAAQWEGSEATARERWDAGARLLLADFPSLQAIEWVDPMLTVRWVLPLPGNEPALGLDLGFEALRREALETARDQLNVVATQPVDLVQGGKGFLVYAPVQAAGRFDGFVLGVTRLEVALGRILANVAHGYAIRIFQGDELLYAQGDLPSRPEAAVTSSVEVRNLAWRIELTPQPEVVATHLTWMPAQAIFGGLINALALVLVLHLAGTRRARALELFEANVALRGAERAEREARLELAAILEDFPDHIWSARVDPERGFETIYYSPIVEKISGHPPRYFLENPNRWLELIHPEDRERARLAYEAVLFRGEHATASEYRITRADGEERWIRDRMRAVIAQGERRVYGVISDVTDTRRAEEERRRLETQMQQAQKLESLGLLAGGIAHDFNNLLVASVGHANLALERLPEDAPARTHIARIESSAQRAAALCRQLLDYAGRGDVKYAPLDLFEVIEDLGELLSAARSKKVTLRYDFEPDLPSVEADASQIRQVLLNLITNASEAIGDGRGEIRVSAAAVECSRAKLDALQLGRRLEAGRYVSLKVSDDGCGIAADHVDQIFEPFYSTKFTGRGLGLAAVLGIVRDHGGALGVESGPGRGTTITLLLPAIAGRAEPLKAPPEAPDAWTGSGTVLVIDDEADVREVATMVLETVGFDTLTAGDGEEGVEVFRRHAQDVVCVLLDLTMPRLDGLETLRMLREHCTDVPVILCSGYPEKETIERFAELGLTGFLQKPYRPRELIACMRQALTGLTDSG